MALTENKGYLLIFTVEKKKYTYKTKSEQRNRQIKQQRLEETWDFEG